jgi:hypothetical protein
LHFTIGPEKPPHHHHHHHHPEHHHHHGHWPWMNDSDTAKSV